MSDLDKHPGYLGLTSRGVILLHADWPIYPEEHGPDLALIWLTAFPPKTIFKRIDDIDRCNLFLACIKNTNDSKPFDSKNFHVAIWHNDLLDLQSKGFIDGVSAITERKWEELNRISLGFVQDGDILVRIGENMRAVELPSLDQYDDEIYSWPEFHFGHIQVTSLGRDYAQIVLAHSDFNVSTLGKRIECLMHLRYFDIAVREACLVLEYKIKEWLNSDLWGEKLVRHLISRLNTHSEIIKSFVKVFCSEIRMALRFIRNDFMHNFRDIDEIQCKAILCRLVKISDELDEVMDSIKNI